LLCLNAIFLYFSAFLVIVMFSLSVADYQCSQLSANTCLLSDEWDVQTRLITHALTDEMTGSWSKYVGRSPSLYHADDVCSASSSPPFFSRVKLPVLWSYLLPVCTVYNRPHTAAACATSPRCVWQLDHTATSNDYRAVGDLHDRRMESVGLHRRLPADCAVSCSAFSRAPTRFKHGYHGAHMRAYCN